MRAIRTFNCKYVQYYCNEVTEELFDLKVDSDENTNLIFNSAYSDSVQLYRDKMLYWRNYYADYSSGSDSNPGTKDKPWKRVPGMADNQVTDFLHPERHPTWADQYRPQMRFKGFGRALLSTAVFSSGVVYDSLYAGVSRTGIPVLLIWGKQDQTVPFELSEVIRRSIPSAEFVPVDSAGHLPHIEQAQLVTARLAAFLEAHPAR